MGCVIVLLAEGDDEVEGLPEGDDPQPIHSTLAYYGEAGTDNEELDRIARERLSYRARQIASTLPPFDAPCSGKGHLGDESPPACVLFLESPEVVEAHDVVDSDPVLRAVGAEYRYTAFTPHVTVRYSDTLDDLEVPPSIHFDRVAVLNGTDREEYPLAGEPRPEPVAAAVAPPAAQLSSLSRHRDDVEAAFTSAYAAALAARQSAPHPSKRAAEQVANLFERALTLAAATGVTRLLTTRRRVKAPAGAEPAEVRPDAAALRAEAERLADAAFTSASKVADALPPPSTGEAAPTAPSPTEHPWVASSARSAATRAAAQGVIDALPAVAAAEGIDPSALSKVWVSQGDERVRPLHRRLHGRVREVGKPFWRELSSGSTLSFPGDPDAPLDETINCRCLLILAHTEESGDVERALALPDTEAPGAAPVSMAAAADTSILKAHQPTAEQTANRLALKPPSAPPAKGKKKAAKKPAKKKSGGTGSKTTKSGGTYTEAKHERDLLGMYAQKPVAYLSGDELQRAVSDAPAVGTQSQRPPLQEDQAPFANPYGSPLLDFSSEGKAYYRDGSVYDADGWHGLPKPPQPPANNIEKAMAQWVAEDPAARSGVFDDLRKPRDLKQVAAFMAQSPPEVQAFVSYMAGLKDPSRMTDTIARTQARAGWERASEDYDAAKLRQKNAKAAAALELKKQRDAEAADRRRQIELRREQAAAATEKKRAESDAAKAAQEARRQQEAAARQAELHAQTDILRTAINQEGVDPRRSALRNRVRPVSNLTPA